MQSRTWRTAIPVVLVFCFLVGPVLAVLDGPGLSENRDAHAKRVIADGLSPDEVNNYEAQGCVVKHVFKDSVSFDCPVEVIPGLKVREAKVYHILDLNADLQTGADHVWAGGITGSGVNVAIIDTGIDTNHPELTSSYLGGYDCVNNDNLPEDDNGHGTHVAGIITGDGTTFGSAKGVAPGAGVYMYKVCDSGGSCYEDDMQCGMDLAVGNGSKVMSISIGGGSYTTANCDGDSLAIMVNHVVSAHGMTAVVAAGNDGRGVSTPGCASGAIAVGAVDSGNNVVYFSGRGPALDIVAPGADILSTTMDGKTGLMSGTSMATPHVAGVVALLYDANAGLTTTGIRQALTSTADPAGTCSKCTFWVGTSCLRTSTVTCTASITGAGVVDALGAYSAVKTGCTANSQCDNGKFCDGQETCASGSCVAGTPVSCPGNSCNTGSCSESTKACTEQPKADGTSCGDGSFCNGLETCEAGTCMAGTAVSCNDGNSCTTDSCSDDAGSCIFTWPMCGIVDSCCGPTCSSRTDSDCSATLCWSGSNNYLFKSSAQAMKFCKCAQGTYGYQKFVTGRLKTAVPAFQYTDTGNNAVWTVTSVLSRTPISSVRCSDGLSYPTGNDYFR